MPPFCAAIRHVENTSRYLISLMVKPGVSADRQGIAAISSSQVFINVSSRAHDGAANKAVQVLLARTLNVPKSQVQLVKGLKGREKVAEVSISTKREEVGVVDWIRDLLEKSVHEK